MAGHRWMTWVIWYRVGHVPFGSPYPGSTAAEPRRPAGRPAPAGRMTHDGEPRHGRGRASPGRPRRCGRSFRRVEVVGASMAPALLRRRPAGGGRPALGAGSPGPSPGTVVAVRDPRLPERILIKRVATVDRRPGHGRGVRRRPRRQHRQPDLRPGAPVLDRGSGRLPLRARRTQRAWALAGGVPSAVMPSPRTTSTAS